MYSRTLLDEFNEIRRSFDQFFENLQTPTRRIGTAPSGGEWTFSPAVESGWTDEYLNLRVVVPGVTEKDLKLTVQGNQLYLQGERRMPENFGKEGYVWNQIPYGKFERVLDLPAGLDVEKLEAQLHDGFLDVRIPLTTAMKPKEIVISSGKTHKQIAA